MDYKDFNNRREAYRKKYLDPRWQRRRLEIYERDSFTCQWCRATDQTLHVHHFYYEDGKDPWDYPDDALITYCSECHEIETELLREASAHLLGAVRKAGFGGGSMHMLGYAFDSLRLPQGISPADFAIALGHSFETQNYIYPMLLDSDEYWTAEMARIREWERTKKTDGSGEE